MLLSVGFCGQKLCVVKCISRGLVSYCLDVVLERIQVIVRG